MTNDTAELARAAGAIPVKAPAGAVLFRPGEACKGFVALRRGLLRVSLTSAAGREIVLYRVRPGEVCLQTFSCLTEGKTYAAEGTVEEAIEGFLLPPAPFDALLQANPAFRAAVMASISARFGEFQEIVEALAFTGLGPRLAAGLLRLAGEGDTVVATHEALAAEIGSAREAVSRQLALFARDGLVALSRGRVELKSRAALARLAAPPA